MSSKKEKKEENPIGFVARPDSIQVDPVVLMNILKATNTLNQLVFQLKQELFNTDQLRYYFEKDIEKVEGTEQVKLKDNFWEEKGGN